MDVLPGNQSGVLFQVQKIIGISVGSGNIRTYHVQWAPAWVSGYHLVGCEHLIEDFLQKQGDSSLPMITTVDETRTIDNDAIPAEDDERILAKNILGKNTSISSNVDLIETTTGKLDGSFSSNVELMETTRNFDDSFSSNEHAQEDLHPQSVVLNDEDVSDMRSHTQRTFVCVKIEDSDTEEGDVAAVSHQTGSPGPSKSSESYASTTERVELINNVENDGNRNVDAVSQEPYEYNKDPYFQDHYQPSQETNDSDAENEENLYSINENKLESIDHLWVQNGPGQYQCVPCGKHTRSKSELQRHLRTHTGERPFKCRVCGKCFSWKECLTSHLKLHTGQRYTCTLCLKTFSDKSNLSRHVKRFCKGPSI